MAYYQLHDLRIYSGVKDNRFRTPMFRPGSVEIDSTGRFALRTYEGNLIAQDHVSFVDVKLVRMGGGPISFWAATTNVNGVKYFIDQAIGAGFIIGGPIGHMIHSKKIATQLSNAVADAKKQFPKRPQPNIA